MLERFIETKGYTSHAPIYRGHGKSPEELLKYTPDHWVEDSEKAFRHLQKLGYEKIAVVGDRKSTRLNSSHVAISYAVFCLKKKNMSSKTKAGHHMEHQYNM